MNKKVKSFLYNLICFAILFILFRFLIEKYTNLTGLMIPITAFVVGTLTAPKFQAVQTPDGEKIFMRWLFLKGVREVGYEIVILSVLKSISLITENNQ